MNILFHFLLSERKEHLIVGNFLADFMKGNKYEGISDSFRKGIFLHLEIDRFSDNHASVKNLSSELFRYFGHYTKVVTDIFFDHFLIQYWNKFSINSFSEDLSFFYEVIQKHESLYPVYLKRFVHRISGINWLEKYGSIDGLNQVFRSLARRVAFQNTIHTAIPVFIENKSIIEQNFVSFYPDIQLYISNFIYSNSLQHE